MTTIEDWTRAIPEANRRWEDMWTALAQRGVVRTPLWLRKAEIPLWNEQVGQRPPAIGVLPLNPGCRVFVLIAAGGAFLFKSAHEAAPVAWAFHREGFNVAILDYRCRPYPNEAICADGARGVQWLRHYAKGVGIESPRIAIVGFSAGGLLISLMNLLSKERGAQPGDAIDGETAVPDAEIMIYGAFTDADIVEAEKETEDRLCGFDYVKARERAMGKIPIRLPMKLPPAFMAQTDDDDPLFLLEMTRAWRDRGVPCEAHLFHGGGHGGGLYDGGDGAEKNAHAARWFDLCREWLASVLEV